MGDGRTIHEQWLYELEMALSDATPREIVDLLESLEEGHKAAVLEELRQRHFKVE